MPTIKSVERSIRNVEGFEVHFHYEHDGRDVRSDKRDLPSYTYRRAAPDRMSVTEWRNSRFQKSYPSYKVEVLDGSGAAVHGRTKLANLRATFD